MRVEGLIIDPQVDFCSPQGRLFVPGAAEDMQRLAAMVRAYNAARGWDDGGGVPPELARELGLADLRA